MGFVTGSIRLLYLTQLKNDLMYKIMLHTEAQRDLSDSITNLMDVGTNLDPDSPVIKTLKARREKLAQVEKEMERKMVVLQSKLKAVEAEIGEAEKLVDASAKRQFSYGIR